jgi:peptide/nickel transport system permease protein
MLEDPWIGIWPGVALSLVVWGVSMFGDALRDLLDPRLRGGIGRYNAKVNRKPKVVEQIPDI